MSNKENSKFSLKKLLKTIALWIVICVFVGTTYQVVNSISFAMMFQVMAESEVVPEGILSYYELLDGRFEEIIEYTKEAKGEDFPASGACFATYVQAWPAYRTLSMYTISVITGIIIGAVVYIVSVQKATKKKLIFELAVAFILIAALIGGGDTANRLILKFALDGVALAEGAQYILNQETLTNWVALYIALAVVLYVVNIVKQKIITHKLNKELNK